MKAFWELHFFAIFLIPRFIKHFEVLRAKIRALKKGLQMIRASENNRLYHLLL